ncbi:MAG: flagellar hook-associated protein FlgK [Calditrichaeota bacterium]|nr:flagellar hook-associated protein FlgK [Calditrichota bacterium]
MPSVNATLAMARRALLAQQAAIQVTGDNIANAATSGYARRRAELRESLVIMDQPGIGFGSGVDIAAVRPLRDLFIEQQVQRARGDAGRFAAAGQQLRVIEAAVGDLGEAGLMGALDRFFSAWNDLARDPASSAPRTIVREAGRSLTDTFNALDRRLEEQSLLLDRETAARIERLNILAEQLARANVTAIQAGTGDQLDDDRVRLLDEIAALSGATYRLEEGGSITVRIGNAILVQGESVRRLEQNFSTEGRASEGLTASGNAVQFTTGEIAGLFTVREDDIVQLRERLDSIASSLVTALNDLHFAGYGLRDSTGVAFFDPSATGAGDIRLSAAVLADHRVIAASLEGDPGDNRLALAIADLETSPIWDNSRATLGEGIRETLAALGARINDNEIFNAAAEGALTQAEGWRDSVSGVSVDEEMTNLIRYENGFRAAAKLVSTVEKMLDTILGMAG